VFQVGSGCSGWGSGFYRHPSASAERVFSLLQKAFNRQQNAALEETVEVSVTLVKILYKQDGRNMLSDKNHRAQNVFLGVTACCVTRFSKLKAHELETVNICSLVR
jgi:glycine/D-amino acid oxidase-like deaminating enzyme